MGENSAIHDDLYAEVDNLSVAVGPFPSLLDDSSCILCTVVREFHNRHHVNCDGNEAACYLAPIRADLTLPLYFNGCSFVNIQTEKQTPSIPTCRFFFSDDWLSHVPSRIRIRPVTSRDQICLGASSWNIARCAVPSRPFLNQSQLNKSSVAFDAIRDCTDACEASHRECDWGLLSKQQFNVLQKNRDRKISPAHPLRYVDVLSDEVVNISPYDCFICLSYVWGNLGLAARRTSFFGKRNQINVGALPQPV